MRLVVDARVEKDKIEVVAKVDEAESVVRFVMGEVALLTMIEPNPDAMDPEESAPVEVMFPCTAVGSVEEMEGAPAPDVMSVPLFAVVMEESVSAAVV